MFQASVGGRGAQGARAGETFAGKVGGCPLCGGPSIPGSGCPAPDVTTDVHTLLHRPPLQRGAVARTTRPLESSGSCPRSTLCKCAVGAGGETLLYYYNYWAGGQTSGRERDKEGGRERGREGGGAYDFCVGTFTVTDDGVGGEWPGPSGSARLDWLTGTDKEGREGTRIESYTRRCSGSSTRPIEQVVANGRGRQRKTGVGGAATGSGRSSMGLGSRAARAHSSGQLLKPHTWR